MRSVDAGLLGAACGKVIGLESRLEDAQKRSDESRQERLEESLMEANPTMQSFLLRLQDGKTAWVAGTCAVLLPMPY
jgi:hypothetical protein